MGWIDYNKKVYDVILHSWILVSFEKVQMSENIVQFIRKLMKNRTQICHYVKNIWQMLTSGTYISGDSLSPLLFVICVIALAQIFRKVELGNTLKNEKKLNHLLPMDDLKKQRVTVK